MSWRMNMDVIVYFSVWGNSEDVQKNLSEKSLKLNESFSLSGFLK